jgi:hypothetical protein
LAYFIFFHFFLCLLARTYTPEPLYALVSWLICFTQYR